MQVRFSTNLRAAIDRLIDTRPSTPAIRTYIVASWVIYIFISVHTPIYIWDIPHDDGLFMALGRHLAQGEWLGSFDQFTLMKGPGYPAFLALANWLGLSVTWAHALFHCAAITFFALVCHRFVKSVVMSGLLFTLLMWHPLALTADLLRVIREAIYYGQLLIFIAAFACAMLGAIGRRERTIYGVLSGLFLGWFWLTREEGIWLAPVLVIILGAAYLRAYRLLQLRNLTVTLAIMVGVFVGTQVSFRVLNWSAYGKFVGVDIKERNFVRAMAAISGVLSGESKPLVTVSRATRQRIYTVSPTFATLAPQLDGPLGLAWEKVGCPIAPVTCGDIGGGWFQWLLRDAAAASGHYSSAREASAFYGRIADEIEVACANKALDCEFKLIPQIPHVRWSQLANVPASFAHAIDLLLMLHPPLYINDSIGTEERLALQLRFLNYPLHTPSPDAGAMSLVSLLGWYYQAGNEWVNPQVKTAKGDLAEFRFTRMESPDIAGHFNNTEASRQRFALSMRCGGDCVLQLTGSDGAKIESKLSELRAGSQLDFGQGHFHVDTADVQIDPAYVQRLSEKFANRLRTMIVLAYNVLFLPVLILGIAAFVAASVMYWRLIAFNACYVLALATWTALICRVTLMVLVDVTWFPAFYGPYLTTAYYMLVCAPVLSIAALRLIVRQPHITHSA